MVFRNVLNQKSFCLIQALKNVLLFCIDNWTPYAAENINDKLHVFLSNVCHVNNIILVFLYKSF